MAPSGAGDLETSGGVLKLIIMMSQPSQPSPLTSNEDDKTSEKEVTTSVRTVQYICDFTSDC